jgi:hypothetical protein
MMPHFPFLSTAEDKHDVSRNDADSTNIIAACLFLLLRSVSVSNLHCAFLLSSTTVLHMVRHLPILAPVGVVVFFGYLAFNLPAGLAKSSCCHARRILTFFQFTDVHFGNFRLPLSGYQRKPKRMPTHRNDMRASMVALLTLKMNPNTAIDGSDVGSSSSLIRSKISSASLVVYFVNQIISCLRLCWCFFLRFLSSAHPIKFLLTVYVFTLPVINASMCNRMELELARGHLAATSLPSGLVFFAGGQSAGASLGAPNLVLLCNCDSSVL